MGGIWHVTEEKPESPPVVGMTEKNLLETSAKVSRRRNYQHCYNYIFPFFISFTA